MASVKELLLLITGKETVSPATKKAAKGLDDLGDAAKEAGRKHAAMAEDIQHVDRQIEETHQRIRTLATEIVRTSDEAERNNLFKTLRTEQTKLRKLTKLRDLLPEPAALNKAGAEAGRSMSTSMIREFGQTLNALPPILKGGLIAGVVAASPAIGAILAGAVSAGIGAGVTGAGIALAFRDPAVQEAGKSLANQVKADLRDAASGFVQPTIDGIHTIQGAWSDMHGDVKGILDDAAGYVQPLVKGMTGLVREMLPGIRTAVRNVEPVIRIMGTELPKWGRAIGDAFAAMTKDGDSAAAGFQLLSQEIQTIIRGSGEFIGMLNSWFGGLLNIADAATTVRESMVWLPDWWGDVDNTRAKIDELKATLAGGSPHWKQLKTDTQQVAEANRQATADIQAFNDAVRDQRAAVLAAANAQLGFEDAIDRATEAGKKNNDGIDVNTAKGRANRQLLLQLAGATQAYAQEILDAGGSQDEANAALERGRAKFISAAIAMGVGKKAAIELANSLFGVPKKTEPEVKPKGIKESEDKIARVKRALRDINDVTAMPHVNVVVNTSRLNKVERQLARYGVHLASGGLVRGPGTGTSDSIPAMVSDYEYIMPSDKVRQPGVLALLESIRNGGSSAGGGGAGRAAVARAGGGNVALVVSAAPGANRDLVNALLSVLRFEVQRVGGVSRLLEAPA